MRRHTAAAAVGTLGSWVGSTQRASYPYHGHGRHPAFALFAFKRVQTPHAPEKFSPFHGAGRWRGLLRVRVATLAVRGFWNHQLPVPGATRQDPKVLTRGMAWCRDEAAQPRQQIMGCEHQHGVTPAVWLLQPAGQHSIRPLLEAVQCQWPTQQIPAQPIQCLTV
jgi:hypothetical protein